MRIKNILTNMVISASLLTAVSLPISAEELSEVKISVSKTGIVGLLKNFEGSKEFVTVGLSTGTTMNGRIVQAGTIWTVINDLRNPGEYFFATVKTSEIISVVAREQDGDGKARKLDITP